MNNTISSTEQMIETINIVLKSKKNAVVNIVNDKLTLSVFALLEQNLKNVKEINFVIRDTSFIPNKTEISHEFEMTPTDILYNSYDIVEKNKLQHFAKAKAMHDFIETHVNVKKANPKIKIGGNIIIIDDDFMIQGSSSLEISSKKRKNSYRNINFDTMLNGSMDKSQILSAINTFNQIWFNDRVSSDYKEKLLQSLSFVIIDEPQKIEGQKGKKSKSLQAIDNIEPLFVLRYSATHKKLYNQIYKLDSYAAYKKDLVKKITVKTVNGIIEKGFPYIRYISFTKDLKARIEMFSQQQGDSIRFKTFEVSSGASLEELSGGLIQYRNMRIAEEPHKNKPLKITTKDGTITLALGKSNNVLEDIEAIRIQIRLAIISHFEKQFAILKKGKKIKTITLFFINSVNKVRDNIRTDGRGEYLRIFDEEYQNALRKYERELKLYKEFLPEVQNVLKVREGYFAIDNNKNEVEIDDWDDSKSELDVTKKSQEDIDRGISLILEKKDELISFQEPLSFIFSHSALREGWDNPNVFTLCALKSGNSDIAKKQEIGRGLRLPVDITGNRCLDNEINELTVIANDSYDNFSRKLQEDFIQNMSFNKNEVTAEVLTFTLTNSGIPKNKITAALVDSLNEELKKHNIIDGKNILKKNVEQTTKALKMLVFKNETLQEHALMIKENFVKYMIEKGTQRIEINNGDNEPYVNSIRAFVTEKEFEDIYQGLSQNLTKRTFYKCNVNKNEFISNCIKEINADLYHFSINKAVSIETGKAKFGETQMFEVEKADEKKIDIDVDMKLIQKSTFEIVNYIMYHTMLPRFAIFKIIEGINKIEALSFQDILDRVTQKILINLNEAKAANITSYEIIHGYELDEGQIFATDTITEEDFNDEWRVFKSDKNKKNALNEYYKMDSKGEREFAEKLEANDNIILFTKLKKGGFIIDTPYGNYSPDWAIVSRKGESENDTVGIYFIVETKAGKLAQDLTTVEANKIKCGELHFKAVSELVKFDWVNSYEDFKTKFGVKESM